MKTFIFLISIMLLNTSITIVNFSENTALRNWIVTNDTVMGGGSRSTIHWDERGFGVFSGFVSTANNGGFSMVRLPVNVALNASFQNIKLKVKGDGKKYEFRIKSSNSQRHWYVQSFQTSGEWEEITLKLKDFYPSFRGYKLQQANFSDDTIREIALLIGNKVDEDFKLMIDSIDLK